MTLILSRTVAIALCAAIAADATAQPSGAALAPTAQWSELTTENYRGKRDDILFVDARTGYYGTGAGDVFRTTDAGASWHKIWSKPGTFVRAIGFADARNGFLGNVGDAYPNVTDRTPLYRTADGGLTWEPVDLKGLTVEGICAIDILPAKVGAGRRPAVIHAAGRVMGPAKILRSVDGGRTWRLIDLTKQAGMILDVKFLDAKTGFVFAGTSGDPRESEALVLKTRDGGATWRAVYRSGRKLENSWKGSLVGRRVGFATVQSSAPDRSRQVIIKTVDGGEHWTEMPLVDNAKARQFGIGFASEKQGWVGTAAGGFETRDGGRTWRPVDLAPAANKIRTRALDGTPMVYAIGTKVQVLRPVSPARR